MGPKIRTRVIDTGGVAKSTPIEGEACQVAWISISAETPGTSGLVKIYDGRGADGKLVWQSEPAYSGHYLFIPMIPCDQGLFIVAAATVACYTVGYVPQCWREEE